VQYISPEQALGHLNLDGAVVNLSLRARLYQMVTVTPPYTAFERQRIVGNT